MEARSGGLAAPNDPAAAAATLRSAERIERLDRDRALLRDRFERERGRAIDADRRFDTLFEASGEALILAGAGLACRRTNPAARALLAPLLALRQTFTLTDLFPAGEREALAALDRERTGEPLVARLEFPCGTPALVTVTILPLAGEERLVRLVPAPSVE